MSKLRTFSICLSDIPKEAIIDHKNGKKYVNLTTWDNDEPDKFGNDFSVSISQNKEEREAKARKTYIGNGKIYKGAGGSAPQNKKADKVAGDLPF